MLVSAFTGGAFALTGYFIGNLTAFVRMVALKSRFGENLPNLTAREAKDLFTTLT